MASTVLRRSPSTSRMRVEGQQEHHRGADARAAPSCQAPQAGRVTSRPRKGALEPPGALASCAVNAWEVKAPPGKPKPDKVGCGVASEAGRAGVLRPSFVPPTQIRAPRDCTRLRADLTRERTRHWQRLDEGLADSTGCSRYPDERPVRHRLGLLSQRAAVARPHLLALLPAHPGTAGTGRTGTKVVSAPRRRQGARWFLSRRYWGALGVR
jgi:hypothetical protein